MPTDPASEFYVTGGTLRPDAPSYVERRADRELLDGLLKGEFCYVLTSRQMGKSSLMVRAATRLREQGIHVIALDLAAIGQNLTSEQWFNGLMVGIGRQLRLDDELERFWDAHADLSPLQRLFAAIREVALMLRTGRLVVFVDELDVVRSLPFKTDEFFAAIRSCYNRRAEDPEFNRLTFCLLGVATPSDLIQDTRITPFNIGRRIELHDFTEEEAAPLMKGLVTGTQPAGRIGSLLRRVLYWTNGHPYLTQRLCRTIAERNVGSIPAMPDSATVDSLCMELFLSRRAREQDDNLLFVRERLIRSEVDLAGLLTLYGRVRRGRPPVRDDETQALVSVLRLSGIVRAEAGFLRVRNRIYESAFNEEWVEATMPQAELKRQKEAYRRGLLRAASVAAAVVLAMAGLVFYAQQQATKARRAAKDLSGVTFKALQNQARLGRLSGLAGRRFDGLAALKLAAEIDPSLAVRNEAIGCLALADLRLATNWSGVVSPGAATVFNRSFSRYAWSDGAGHIEFRPAQGDGVTVHLPAIGPPASRLWLSPNESHLAAAYSGSERVLALWDLRTLRAVYWVTNVVAQPAFDFSPDNRWAAISEGRGTMGQIHLVNLIDGTSRSLSSVEGLPRELRFSRDGKHLAAAGAERLKVEIMDVSSGEMGPPFIPPDLTEALDWSTDGALLAAGCRDGGVYVWDLATRERRDLRGHQGPLTHLSFAHRGHLLTSSGVDQTVRLWDADRGGAASVTLEGVEGTQPLQFREDDLQLAGSMSQGRVRLFEVAPGVEWRSLFSARVSAMTDMDIHPNGRLLSCAMAEGVAIWDLESGRQHCVLELGKGESAAFNPVTGHLVASDFRGVQSIPVRRLEEGGGVRIGPAENLNLVEDAGRLAFSADGRWLAMAQSNRVVVLDGRSNAMVARLAGGAGWRTVAVSSNGQWVAAGNWTTGEVWIWEVATSNRVAALAVAGPAHVAFSADGNWLATATAKEGRLWRKASWRLEARIPLSTTASGPMPTALSNDGAVWACGVGDGRIALFHSTTPLALLEAPVRENLVWLRFSSDGARLFGAAESKSIQVWDLAALRSGLAELKLDWTPPPLLRTTLARSEPMVVSNAVGWFVNAPQLSETLKIHQVVMITDEMKRLGRTADRLRKRAESEIALRMYGEAIADWKECLQLRPTNTTVLRDLAWCYLSAPAEFRDYAAARTLATRLVEIEPQRPDNQFRLGAAHCRTGDYTNALARLQLAATLRIDGKVGFIRAYESICYANLNQLDTAKETLAKSVELAERDPAPEAVRAQLAALQEEAMKLLEEKE